MVSSYVPLPTTPSQPPISAFSGPPPTHHAPRKRSTTRLLLSLFLFTVVALLVFGLTIEPGEGGNREAFLPSKAAGKVKEVVVAKGKEWAQESGLQGWWTGIEEDGQEKEIISEEAEVEGGGLLSDLSEGKDNDEEEEVVSVHTPAATADDDDNGPPMDVDDGQDDEDNVDEDDTAVKPPQRAPRPVIVPLKASSCPPSLLRSLSNPATWKIRRTSRTSFHISSSLRPRTASQEPCFSSTIFSARLVSPVSAKPGNKIIYALSPPSLSPTDDQSYTLTLPPALPLPYGIYELEVVLEFGYLPGAREALVCGSKGDSAVEGSEGDVCETGRWKTEVKFGGGKVQGWERDGDKRVMVATKDLALVSPPRCTTFTSLPGYWLSKTFYPLPPHQPPCSLITPSFPVPFPLLNKSPSSPKTKEPIWIHLIGDSNPRNLFTHLSGSFGKGEGASFFTMEGGNEKNGTIASVGYHSLRGNFNRGAGEPDIIVTWVWWTQTSHPSEFTKNIGQLQLLLEQSLFGFLSQHHLLDSISPFPQLLEGSRTLTPHRTYLSFGSHSEALTSTGYERYLSLLSFPLPSQLRIFTTTLVNALNIPPKFAHQDLTRNNPVIRAKNAVLRRVMEERGEARKVVDVEGLTEGITQEWMKKVGRGGREVKDAVHFEEGVYKAWVNIVWTEMVLS